MVRRRDARRIRHVLAGRARLPPAPRSATSPAPSSTRARRCSPRRGRSGASSSRSMPRPARTSRLTRTLSAASGGARCCTPIDLTVTPAGGRLLAERLAGPLTDPVRIAARLDAVGFAVADRRRRAEIRAILKSAPDMARALSRLSLGRGGPRDLAALRDGRRGRAELLPVGCWRSPTCRPNSRTPPPPRVRSTGELSL